MRKWFGTAAAALALGTGLTGLTAGTAAAEGTRCDGTQVVTCTFMVFDSVTEVRARASITDTANDGNAFQVKVEYLRVERRVNGGPWEQVRWMHDLDGMHDNYDDATTNPYFCGPGTEVRSVARFTWRGIAEKTEWQTGVPISCGRPQP